ncbi:MAG: hypothetical protein Q7P63_11355 [Verrucomicrobiota bacterium JB022]|nr:hypothetical protein [Verrucomicrobiota bacterium JB022]
MAESPTPSATSQGPAGRWIPKLVFRDQSLTSVAQADPLAHFGEKTQAPAPMLNPLSAPPPPRKAEPRNTRPPMPVAPAPEASPDETDAFLNEVFGTADEPIGDLKSDEPDFPSFKQLSQQQQPPSRPKEEPPVEEMSMEELLRSAAGDESPEEPDHGPLIARHPPDRDQPHFPATRAPFASQPEEDDDDRSTARHTRSPLRLRVKKPQDEEAEATDNLSALDALDEPDFPADRNR